MNKKELEKKIEKEDIIYFEFNPDIDADRIKFTETMYMLINNDYVIIYMERVYYNADLHYIKAIPKHKYIEDNKA